MDAERKFVDLNDQGNIVAPGYVVATVNCLSQGVASYERVGNIVTPIEVSLDVIYVNQASNLQILRTMLVWDFQPSITGPATYAEVIEDLDSTGAPYSGAYSNPKDSDLLRFVILYDQKSMLYPTGIYGCQHRLEVTCDLTDLQQAFRGPTDSQPDISIGALYLFNYVASNDVDVIYLNNTRYTYSDY